MPSAGVRVPLKMVLQMASRLMAREMPLRRSALLNGSAVVLQVR